MKPTFENTVNILVQAYLNDELKHQDCSCCAVGNIISNACGYQREVINDKAYWTIEGKVFKPQKWLNVFGTKLVRRKPKFIQKLFGGEPKISTKSWFDPDRIDENKNVGYWAKSTGYTIIQLAKIERAFEASDFGKSQSEWMFNGLMAVVDVLADIHGVDLSVKESAKLQFVR